MNLLLNFAFAGLVVFHVFFNVWWTIFTAFCSIYDSMNANKRKLKEIQRQQEEAKKKIQKRKQEILEGNKKNDEQSKKTIVESMKKKMDFIDDDFSFGIIIARDVTKKTFKINKEPEPEWKTKKTKKTTDLKGSKNDLTERLGKAMNEKINNEKMN
jgi:hypothetical protein